ncbi:AAA family ATPase, partial [Rhizobium leguminosarum]|uniref:AAA family ATPase n=1 Tax=Rhizobium leguminosarum TaxID=384 RepID=UPI003F9CC96D
FQPVLDVLQRRAPVTVLDVPHAWSAWTRSVLSRVDEVVIAAVPDLANLRNAKNILDALRKMRPNDRPPHLILNQGGMPKRPEMSPSDCCEPLEIDPIAIIPCDINLFGN